jgi:hypothetical protein
MINYSDCYMRGLYYCVAVRLKNDAATFENYLTEI